MSNVTNIQSSKRQATRKEQVEIIQDAVVTLINQSAEISGLRNWLIWAALRHLKKGEWPNGEIIIQGGAPGLIEAFTEIIDPDDEEFLQSKFYLDCATEKGIFRLDQLLYESELID